jgi:hypothetical protein
MLVRTMADAVERQVLAHPVHAGPDARRRHRHQYRGGRPGRAAASSSRRARSSRNIVLADEINRATPKTQSALLEAMQERSVTVCRHRRIKL